MFMNGVHLELIAQRSRFKVTTKRETQTGTRAWAGNMFQSTRGKYNAVVRVALHSSDKECWYDGERELLLQLVVEQPVDGAGSYGRHQLQRPEVKRATGSEKYSRTPLRTSLSDFSLILSAIWSGVKVLSMPRRYAAKPAT